MWCLSLGNREGATRKQQAQTHRGAEQREGLLIIIVRFSVRVCVTDMCIGQFMEIRNKSHPVLVQMQATTFNCQIKDCCVFYGTGGNPRL